MNKEVVQEDADGVWMATMEMAWDAELEERFAFGSHHEMSIGRMRVVGVDLSTPVDHTPILRVSFVPVVDEPINYVEPSHV